MQIKSEFRKALGRRIGFGCVLFVITLLFVSYTFLSSSQVSINPLLVMACMILLFLIYVSPDVFKISKLTITENGIEKMNVVTGHKQFIPFETIHYIKKGKIKMRNRGGADISDGFHFSTIVLENKKSFIISPDHFENYKDVMIAIKSRAGFED